MDTTLRTPANAAVPRRYRSGTDRRAADTFSTRSDNDGHRGALTKLPRADWIDSLIGQPASDWSASLELEGQVDVVRFGRELRSARPTHDQFEQSASRTLRCRGGAHRSRGLV